MHIIRLLVLLVTITGLAACTTSMEVASLVDDPPASLAPRVLLDEVPFFPQQEYQCGPAALATALAYSGSNVTAEQLVEQVYIPARHGSLQLEMLAASRSHRRIPYLIEPTLAALLEEVNAGNPVLVFQNLGLDWLPQWHYAVVVGFDLDSGMLTLRSGTIRDYTIRLSLFEKTWRRTGNWGFIVLEPGELPAAAEPIRYLDAIAAMEQVTGPELVTDAYLAALERWPETPLFLFALGNQYYQQGDLASARVRYTTLVTQHPDFPDGHNNLAQVLLELGEPESAEAHARQAIELGGTRIALYRDTLADIMTANPVP